MDLDLYRTFQNWLRIVPSLGAVETLISLVSGSPGCIPLHHFNIAFSTENEVPPVLFLFIREGKTKKVN